jgi:two-component system sensor histidine kinase BarA
MAEKSTAIDDTTRDVNQTADQFGEQRVEELIEQLQQRTAELEEANRELRRLSHYRSLFLARMSHELRTPLTSVLGFTEILLDHEQLSETQRRYCEKIQDSGFQLRASLDQLVDLSRLEGGSPEVFLQEFSLRETLRDSCAALRRFAQKHQVKVDYEISPQLTTIVSDEAKLRQVLYNFLGWAISRSKTDARVLMIAEPGASGRLRIYIDDDGETLAELHKFFDTDRSVDSTETDEHQLGVMIGQRLLEVMDGSVELQNRDAGGLRIVIEVPARPPKG